MIAAWSSASQAVDRGPLMPRVIQRFLFW